MKVTVIGAGIHGLGAAWGCARAGHDVTVIEQGPIPNPAASSVDQHRLIRAPYGALEGYGRLIPEAFRAWDLLWRDLGETLYVETGMLVLSDARSSWARESAAALERIGRPVDWLDRGDLARRFPLVNAADVDHAFHLPDGGALLAGRIVSALARHLAARGVALRPGTAARTIEPEHAAVLLADGSRVEADALVIAAGAWIPKLLPALAPRLTPSRQAVLYFEPPADMAAAWRQAPAIIDLRDDAGFYLVPPVAGTGLKVGDHRFSRTGDPDGDRVARSDEGAGIPEACRARLAGFDKFRLVEKKICFYTVTADERFLVEPLSPRTLVASPCSGHGFKFGALWGLEIAQAIGDAAAMTRLAARMAGGLD